MNCLWAPNDEHKAIVSDLHDSRCRTCAGAAPAPARLRRLAAQLHSLGPNPLYHYLTELSGGADPWVRLERYAALAELGDFIRLHGGDQLPLRARLVGGAAQ